MMLCVTNACVLYSPEALTVLSVCRQRPVQQTTCMTRGLLGWRSTVMQRSRP